MNEILILLILSTIWAVNPDEISCAKQAKLNTYTIPLRLFRIASRVNVNEDDLRQKVDAELEKQRERINSEKFLQGEAMRRRIYVTNLLKFQGGSSILKDFLTNRF